jgi:hypothetical protein
MADWHTQGKGLHAIARDLNRLNIRATHGGPWYASSVKHQLMTVSSCP